MDEASNTLNFESDNIEDTNDFNDSNEIFSVVDNLNKGNRIDVFLYKCFSDVINSRNFAQKLIEMGNVTVNGKFIKANHKLKLNDNVCFILPEPEELNIEPENIPIDIIYEDKDILIINKQRGLVVHPAPGNYSGTLVNALLYHCSDLSDINGIIRPGIVHRIDKDTTGLLVVAKNNAAHLFLSQQLKEHEIKRTYIAITEGIIENNCGSINLPIGRHAVDRKKMAVKPDGGKNAITHFKVIERLNNHTLVECELETGRTHQIRVHLSHIGYPIVGDPLYGKRDSHGMLGQALHARQLVLTHPSTKDKMCFEAEAPIDFINLRNELTL